MFCKYCGRQIKEGETCVCRQPQNGDTVKMQAPSGKQAAPGQSTPKQAAPRQSAPKQAAPRQSAPKQAAPRQSAPKQTAPRQSAPKQVQPQREPKENGGGKKLAFFSFVCSVLGILLFVLLRFVLKDTLSTNSALEGFYPYMIYVVPLLFGVVALLLAVFSFQDKGIRTLSLAGLIVSVLFMGSVFGIMAAFPYEADSYEDSDDDDEEEDDDEDEDDADDEEGDSDKEDEDDSKAAGELDKIKKDYKDGNLDYVEAKDALMKIDEKSLDEKGSKAVLEFQETIEQDLQKEMEKLAAASDYEGILATLSNMEEASESEDAFLTGLREKYEPEYIAYLQTESKKLTEAGQKDDAVEMLEGALELVEDENAVSTLILDVQNTVGSGDYVIPGSDSRYLTNEEISSLTIQEVNYAKNEIYARHGRKFQSNELQTYFNSKSWYNGTIAPGDFSESVLNNYEKKNAELLSKREFSMQSGGYKLDVN